VSSSSSSSSSFLCSHILIISRVSHISSLFFPSPSSSFLSVFPVGPFIGYVSNIQQIHQFGSSVLWRKRRLVPEGAQDIGSFQNCFETMATMAMVSNSALVFFAMRDKVWNVVWMMVILEPIITCSSSQPPQLYLNLPLI
jgi:hypothetical protein